MKTAKILTAEQKIRKLKRAAKKAGFAISLFHGELCITTKDKKAGMTIGIRDTGRFEIKAVVRTWSTDLRRRFRSIPMFGKKLREQIREQGKTIGLSKVKVEELIQFLDSVTA